MSHEKTSQGQKKSSGIRLSYRISNTRNEFVLEFLIDKDPGLGLVVTCYREIDVLRDGFNLLEAQVISELGITAGTR